MKKIIAFLVIAVSAGFSQTNIVDTSISANTYNIILTASTDSAIIMFNNVARFSYHSVFAYTSSAGDTVKVYLQQPSGSQWSQTSVIDKSSGSSATQMILSTTNKEFIPFDSYLQKMMFVTSSVDTDTTYITVRIK